MEAGRTPALAGGVQSGHPTARRIVLGAQLRRQREAAEIPRAEAGYAIRASESKISRMELGRVSFKERDVADLLTMYGVSDAAEREYFLDLVRQSNQLGWWHRYGDLVPDWFQDYVGLEESASRIQTYELQLVPGLMQTEAYARAVVTGGTKRLPDEEVNRRVGLRMQRQKLMHRPDAPQLWAVVDEAVLRRPVGGRQVLRDQIEQLRELTARPNVALQIVPNSTGWFPAESSFTVLRFAESELPDIVYIEHLSGALYLDKRSEVEQYSTAVDQLAVSAETPRDSRQLLRKLRAEI